MNGAEAIIAAVKARDGDRVAALLKEEPALLQTRTPDGSLLLTAVYNGARDVVQVLLSHNPPLDIFEAATVGHAERITALLAADPDQVHAANSTGFEPLHLAAFFGHAAAVQALLAAGASVDRIMRSQSPYVPSNTALHAAVAGGPHADVVKALVAAGADVNLLDSNGHTPLHAAAFHKDTEVITYLLQHGADVNRHGDCAPTPLAYALAQGNEAQAAVLRAAGGVE